jgi:uncharacterized RDD family membrane protein YckC
MAGVRDTHVVRTPENVTFEFELAGLTARGLALAIDMFLMAAATLLVALVLVTLAEVVGGIAFALLILAMFLIQWWYMALFEWRFAGQTVGKRVVGLRTLQDDGLPVTFLQAVVRNLVRIVDMLPLGYLVGATTTLLDRHRRRLGDMAAGTIVVRERTSPPPSTVVPPSERHNSFMTDPVVAHAIRRITAPERDAMVSLAMRREGLALPLRRRLFARMAAHLSRRLGVSRPPFFSEEKFVLNLTAAMLARSSGAQASQ